MALTKLKKRRWNEKLKRQADYFNGVAISLFGGGVIAPLVAMSSGRAGWFAGLLALVFLIGSYVAHRLCLSRVRLIMDVDDAA